MVEDVLRRLVRVLDTEGLPPARAMVQAGFAAVLFVAVTVGTHAAFPAAASVVGVGSLVSIGLLVGALRVQVDDLVRALAKSAASDPLTACQNGARSPKHSQENGLAPLATASAEPCWLSTAIV
jgi:hypothetical protein